MRLGEEMKHKNPAQRVVLPRRGRRSMAILAAASVAASSLLSGCMSGADDDRIQVYSARHYDLEEAFQAFADDTGVKVDFLFGSDAELRERIAAEGEDTVADVYLTVDAGNLAAAADQGIFQPLDSEVVNGAVAEEFRDPDNQWFGLAKRTRTIIYAPDRVDPSELSTYEDLADSKWEGRLCLRTANASYTQSLVASMIAEDGEEKTEEVVSGWAANSDIYSNDVEIINNVDSGKCDVGIVNHYYLARELKDHPDLNVELFWANQDTTGVHVNISGGGVVKNSDNVEGAEKLVEWLATTGQAEFVGDNMEYPINPDVEVEPILAEFGDFTEQQINARAYAELNPDAVALMGRAGYR